MTQPAYLKNLKRYARVQFGTDDDAKEVVADLVSESDRGAVILSATGIEDTLQWACVRAMRGLVLDEGARENVFGANGFASTFSNKIHLAYGLGIVDRRFRDLIDLIREIRNACAHCRKPINFDTPELRAAVEVVLDDFIPLMVTPNRVALRHAFTLKCGLINQAIISGVYEHPAEVLARQFAEHEASQKTPPPLSSPAGPLGDQKG